MNDFDTESGRYVLGLDCLTGLCRSLNLLPLDEMAAMNERLQTLGPVLDPTAYQQYGGLNLHDQRRIIDAAAALQRVCFEIRDRELGRPT